ncbi:MAG: zinc-binding alcohol dehydrogenase family protein [Rhodospirillaceae bacterium]|nr:zinc-binding alcohol dehydrogenase family protein [Rhodospirillaceae bacterium]
MSHKLPYLMRAMVIDTPGPPAGLSPRQIPVPKPGEGQALLKVAYVGMNPLDGMARAGKIDFLPITWPFVPGLEKTGVVVAVGAGVDQNLIGQRVIARLGFGGYADYALSQAKLLLPLDPRIDLKTGCVYRGCSFTAWHGLHKAGRLQKGETVLIHSAAGAIGIMAMQIAKDFGCKVIGLCGGAAKVAYAKTFGPDHVFDYTEADWPAHVKAATAGRGCDVILDGNGGPNAEHNVDLAAKLGRIVYIGATAGSYPAPVPIPTLIFKNIAVAGMNLAPIEDPPGSATDKGIIEAVATGRWTVPISETVELADVADLHARLESRRVMGRAVVKVGGDLMKA